MVELKIVTQENVQMVEITPAAQPTRTIRADVLLVNLKRAKAEMEKRIADIDVQIEHMTAAGITDAVKSV